MKKKYCSVYVRNDVEGPSCYYRIIQYMNKINKNIVINNVLSRKEYRRNLDCTNKYKKKVIQGWLYILMLVRVTFFLLRDLICKPTYIIVSRTVIPRYTPLYLEWILIGVLKRSTLYWDFDDHIFNNGEISKNQANILSYYSKNIIVTSKFLRSKLDIKYQNKVILLPTTDGDMQNFDQEVLNYYRMTSFHQEIRLVWVATSSNIPNLLKIIETLDDAARKLIQLNNKQLILTVVCNISVEFEGKYLIIRNIKWTRERAEEEIFKAHIGIMPLINREYALGKGGFKLVQYISTGLPVIASKIGFNIEIVNDFNGILIEDKVDNEGWVDAIVKITQSWCVWETFSIGSYKTWKEKFSFERNLKLWKNLLDNIGEENKC
jgi:glycosyltransferase involved in cell wall biosynthesis